MYSKKDIQRLASLTGKLLKSSQNEKHIFDLRTVLRFHEWKYYVDNDPLIADFEYDQLFSQLQEIEKNHPDLISPDSPTQRVGSDLSTDLGSVEHIVPQLSLANSYNSDDLLDFDKQLKKLLSKDENEKLVYTVEPKFDGGSIALIYEDDYLVRGATRGNGAKGEDMTPNARVMSTIPLKANFTNQGIRKVELRGEALIRKDRFAKLNIEREKAGETILANPRNAATGGLRTKDPNETRRREIEAFIFHLGYAEDNIGNNITDQRPSHFKNIKLLSRLGFKVPQSEMKLCQGINEVIAFCKKWEAKRESFDYEIDGMVVKLDDIHQQIICGSTSHHPRWAIAYKFKAKQATTTLLDVEYQVGKVGSITPVAKVEPVHLAGVTISSISLHNEEFIESKDLRLGDQIVIERAGDVIPYVVKSLPDLRKSTAVKIIFPKNCPSCDTQLIKLESEAAWRCMNPTCEVQILQRMIFHVSKDAMDIDGFGKSYVEKFYSLGWLRDMSDIYNLDYEVIEQLEGFGEKSATKLNGSITKAMRNPIQKLLHSLSVHHLGRRASQLIAAEIDHVLDLREWNTEQFTEIKDIGPVVAQNVISYFADDVNIEMLKRMESYGVNLTQLDEDKPLLINEDAPLAGKTILFTGTLTHMGRNEAQRKAELAGAKNISAISKNLNILVAGEKAGSKLKKAQALGTVEIMTEDQFIELVG